MKRLHLEAHKLSIVQHLEHSNTWNSIVMLFFKHSTLSVEVTLNRNYTRYNSVCFATVWQFKTLYTFSE
jgi:uncharacterized membrane protein YpjA